MAWLEFYNRFVCHCDVPGCHVVWLGAPGRKKLPERCGNRDKRHKNWDREVWSGSNGDIAFLRTLMTAPNSADKKGGNGELTHTVIDEL